MTATEEYVARLTSLKVGERGLLRAHAGQRLDESLQGFDLFAGLWWPLRQKNQRAPRREVAWLIAKLYASCPMDQSYGAALADQLRKSRPREEPGRSRFAEKFDRMLRLPIGQIEPALRWSLDWVADRERKLDWVMLTDDLSRWERETIRMSWAEQFLGNNERGASC